MSRAKKFLIGPAAFDCNRGDQALVWEAIDSLRQVNPDCEIAIMSDIYDDPEDIQSRQTRKLGINILPSLLPNPRGATRQEGKKFIDSGWSLVKIEIRAIRDFIQMQGLLIFWQRRKLAKFLLGEDRYKTYEFLQDCDAMVVKGGGYIYAYRGLRWAYYIWFGLFPLMLAQKFGVKVIILPNSFGPFETRWGRWLARRVLSRCELVTARESKSFVVLNAVIPGKAKLFPDMGFNLEPADSKWAKRELISHGVPLGKKPCVGITMRPWRFPNAEDPQARYRNYISSFVELCEYLLKKGYTPVLYAHVIGPHAHENDRIALKDVLKEISQAGQVVYIDGDYNCKQIKPLYGQMDFMISTRFHSAIFSIAQQVPCLAVSYQGYKATGIMDEIGLRDYCLAIDKIDGDLLIEAFETLVANRKKVKEKMSIYIAHCKQRLNQLRDLITEKIGGANRSSK